jgi:hypothetical protein
MGPQFTEDTRDYLGEALSISHQRVMDEAISEGKSTEEATQLADEHVAKSQENFFA